VSGRIWRWVGGGLLLGLLPLLAAYLFALYRHQRAPALREILGAGQALLVGVMWCAAALRESRDAPDSLKAHRDFVQIAATAVLILGAAGYGFVTADNTAGRSQTDRQAGYVTTASLALLGFAATISSYAVAINQPEGAS
jgi:hypothetical protein